MRAVSKTGNKFADCANLMAKVFFSGTSRVTGAFGAALVKQARNRLCAMDSLSANKGPILYPSKHFRIVQQLELADLLVPYSTISHPSTLGSDDDLMAYSIALLGANHRGFRDLL